jgi:hypothetical protein
MTEPRTPRQGQGMPPARGGAPRPAASRPDASPPPYRAALDALDETRPMRAITDGGPLLPAPEARPPRPVFDARPVRARSDPNPLRLLIGLAGLATASAITTALLPSILPSQVAASTSGGNNAAAVAPAPSMIHVTRTVQLAPGQSAPPNSSVQVQPQPTPQVQIQVITRQSGRP